LAKQKGLIVYQYARAGASLYTTARSCAKPMRSTPKAWCRASCAGAQDIFVVNFAKEYGVRKIRNY